MSLHDALLAKAFGGGANIDVVASVGQTIVVEEVDADGKPTKWKATEFQPRTHWSEVVKSDIVPETTFTPTYDASLGCTMANIPAFALELGKTYTVIFDGTEYTLTPFTGVSVFEFIAVGNTVFAGGENNGVPFAVAATSVGYFLVLCMDANEHTVRVIGDKTIHYKIPEEYLSKSDFKVELGYSATGGKSLLTPWEDIIDAAKKGKNIYAVSKYQGGGANGDVTGYGNVVYTCFGFHYGVNGSLRCTMDLVNVNTAEIEFVEFVRNFDGTTSVETNVKSLE